MTPPQPADPQRVRHALRSLRPTLYTVQATPEATTLALVQDASDAARRNAARKIVGLLAEHGLHLAAGEDDLTASRDGFAVSG